MIKNYLLFIVIIGFQLLASCQKNSNKVEYAIKEYYLLNENEEFITKDKVDLDQYAPFHGIKETQVPLNKVIFGDNYKVFIGIAFQTDAQKLYENLKTDTSYFVIDSDNRDKFLCAFIKKDSLYSFNTIYDTRKPVFTVVMNFAGTDSTIISKIYNDHSLLQEKLKTR